MNQPEAYSAARGDGWRLALATFALLALELACIRWLSGQIRVLAYFNNLVLIAAFLGMGLGIAIARRRPELRHHTLPAVAAFVLLIAVGSPLGLASLSFPDLAIHLWGGESQGALTHLLGSLLVVLGLFWFVAGIFLLAGVSVGYYFGRLETLKAYSFDLLGSLLGVLAIAGVTALGTPPPVWFLVGALGFLALSPGAKGLVSVVVIVAGTWYSVDGAVFSPYNRIDLVQESDRDIRVRVNRDFHQFMYDLSDERIASETDPNEQRRWAGTRTVYDLPYIVGTDPDRVLILGAGSGNDARAAVRSGGVHVTAVDIDPRILALGTEMHPEAPYRSPNVVKVVNDARAYLEQYDGEPFDVVSYGFLDSHAMFSTMSSLRLENYVYTEEGLTAAWEHVAEGGHLSLTFSVLAGQWLVDRLYWTLAEATGIEPVVIGHNLYGGATFLVGKGPLNVEVARDFPLREGVTPRELVRTTSDDWPFLYLRPDRFPLGYVLLLAAVLLTGTLAVRKTFGREVTAGGFDAPLFFMGAAFLLLETRAVTSLSLLFGTTWLVNAAVFSGILATVLVANLGVARFRPKSATKWFIPLLGSLLLLWLLPVGTLNALSLGGRWIVGGLLVGLPVGLAGIIVSVRLSQSANPTAALGSNLLGAVLGGTLEYLSMSIGLQPLVLLAASLYLGAWWFILREGSVETAATSA